MLTAIWIAKCPSSFLIVVSILSIAFSRAFSPSCFSGVEVVITANDNEQFDFQIYDEKDSRDLPYNGGAIRLILIGISSVDASSPARSACLTASIPS